MKTRKGKKVISAVIIIAMLFSMLVLQANAVVTTIDGVTYTSSSSSSQSLYTISFNPQTGDYVPMAYSKNAGTGATVSTDVADAGNNGYTVMGGTNCDFFSMETATYGVLVGYGTFVGNGKLYETSIGASGSALAFQSDGNASLVTSSIGISMKVNGSAFNYNGGSAIAHVNKRSSTWDNRFYYWDNACGTITDSSTEGLEIVCNKVDSTELTIGGTLRAEVAAIRTNSYASSFTDNQFVLYCINSSSMYTQAAGIAVGDDIEISVNEQNSTYKDTIESANTLFTAAIPFVQNGSNITSSLASGGYIYGLSTTQTARRTGIGIKSDGTVILACSTVNITLSTFADKFVNLGCVTAVNLDGGGSTQMNFNGSVVVSSTRKVGNSLLIVHRDTIPTATVTTLTALVNEAATVLASDNVALVQAAYDDGAAVLASNTSMKGDYTRAIMKLQDALDAWYAISAVITTADSIAASDYSDSALAVIAFAYDDALAVLVDQTATKDDFAAIGNKLSASLGLSGTIFGNLVLSCTYTNINASASYPDSDYELTDGVFDTTNSPFDAAWSGYTQSSATGYIDGVAYMDTVIDLGSVKSGMTEFSVSTMNMTGWGIYAPGTVDILISYNGAIFNEVGEATTSTTLQNNVYQEVEYTLTTQSGYSGRYIKFRLFFAGTFIFLDELSVYAYDSPHTSPVWISLINTKVITGSSNVFTYGYADTLTSTNANLNWALAIAVGWDDTKKAYVITDMEQGYGSNSITTIPTNGFVFGLHDGTTEGNINHDIAANAEIGDIVVVTGVDSVNCMLYPGAHFNFFEYVQYYD